MTASRSKRPASTPAEISNEASAVKSLRKALGILNCVANSDHPLTVAEVALETGLARPTAHRLAQTLIAEGHLWQDPLDGRLSVGFSVLQLASSLLDRNRLRIEALPHLQVLAQKTGERANLGIIHQNRLLYLAGVEKPSLPTIYSRFGKTAPVHCSSLGKAIAAYLPEAEFKKLIAAAPLDPQTPKSITSFRRFVDELNEVRVKGYAVDIEEHQLGSFCLAAPIFDRQDRVVGAIGLSGRSLEPLLAEVDTIRHTAELITHVL
jgi:IclR family KDG regulon transcriptional repressor